MAGGGGGDKASMIALWPRYSAAESAAARDPGNGTFPRVGQELRWFPSSTGAAGGGAGLAPLPLPDPGVGADHQPALPQGPV